MYIRQKYIDTIIPFVDKPLIKVLSGMRRTGKSTLMRQLADRLRALHGEQRVLYINMESLDNAALSDIAALHRFVRDKKETADGALYLFIDEVQEIPGWERAVNSFLADGDADIFISGSTSKLMSGELADLLTGRYVEFRVYPLVYSEFAEIRGGDSSDESLFMEFLTFGGMPGIHHLEFDALQIYQYLTSLRDSVVLKDVVKRFNVRDVGLLEKILLFLFDNIGNITSARKVADYFKSERRSLGHETVYNYLKYLETAGIILEVPRFDIRGKKLLEVNAKYFVADIGLCHTFGGYREEQLNAYLENIVFTELLYRGYTVTVGRIDDVEVDFIARRRDETIYVQVCYLLTDESVLERETRPFYKIDDNYPKYLLTLDRTPESSRDGIMRRYLPGWLCDY